MNGKSRHWLFSASLATALTLGASGLAASAQKQPPEQSIEQQQLTALKSRVDQDKALLSDARQKYGKNSPQARSASARLKGDQKSLKDVQKGIKQNNKVHQQQHPPA